MRTCTRCRHDRSQHMEAEEGYCAPCEMPNCSCLGFDDPAHRTAAAAIVGKPEKAPAGYVH